MHLEQLAVIVLIREDILFKKSFMKFNEKF